MMTHTPGPWEYHFLADGVGYYIVPVGKEWQCDSICGEMRSDYDVDWSAEPSLADARLIAASPDLLAALESLATAADELIGACDYGPFSPTWAKAYAAREAINVARAAIAKAEGR